MTETATVAASLTADLIATAATHGLSAFDGEPDPAPSGIDPRYLSITVQTGTPSDTRLAAAQPNYRTTVIVMCVARTRDGLRALAATTRAALEHHRPLDGRFLLTERRDIQAPILTGGPTGDKRHTTNLYFTVTVPRSLL